jgi:hypothetical protein
MAELTVPRLDFSVVGELPDVYRNARTQATREMTLANLGRDGNPNYEQAAAALLRGGDLAGGMQLAQLGKALRPEQTNDIKNFTYAQTNPAFAQYQIGLKQAGANKNTINMPPMEKEYDKTVGKEFGEQNVGIIKGAQDAQRKIGTLDRLGQLLNDPNIYTGAGADTILQAKKIAKAAGFDVGDLSGPEAVKAISNQFALELRNPAGGAGMPGAMSDKDREFLQASVPGLQQTPAGNAKIIDYMKRVAKRSLEVDKLRREYVQKNGRLNEGFYQALAQYSEANPIFPEANQARPTPAARPQRAAPSRQELEAEMRRRGLLR